MLLLRLYCRLCCSWCWVLCRQCCQSRSSLCHSSVPWSTAWLPIISDSRYMLLYLFTLNPVHTGDYGRRIRRQIVAQFGESPVWTGLYYTILLWHRQLLLCSRQIPKTSFLPNYRSSHGIVYRRDHRYHDCICSGQLKAQTQLLRFVVDLLWICVQQVVQQIRNIFTCRRTCDQHNKRGDASVRRVASLVVLITRCCTTNTQQIEVNGVCA